MWHHVPQWSAVVQSSVSSTRLYAWTEYAVCSKKPWAWKLKYEKSFLFEVMNTQAVDLRKNFFKVIVENLGFFFPNYTFFSNYMFSDTSFSWQIYRVKYVHATAYKSVREVQHKTAWMFLSMGWSSPCETVSKKVQWHSSSSS